MIEELPKDASLEQELIFRFGKPAGDRKKTYPKIRQLVKEYEDLMSESKRLAGLEAQNEKPTQGTK